MAVSQKSIFQDLSPSLDFSINPYAKVVAENKNSCSLPLAYGPELHGKSGKWKSFFKDSDRHGFIPRKLVLEIGCHKGRTLNQIAAMHPNIGFIGMDITFKRVVLTAKHAIEMDNSNLCSVLGDARQIDQIFAGGELDGVLAFFPDPWEKKRSQSHKKLFNEDFMNTLAHVLKPNGQFWFKTDVKTYFHDLASSVAKVGMTPIAKSQSILEGDYETYFESKFKSQNLPTFEALWAKS